MSDLLKPLSKGVADVEQQQDAAELIETQAARIAELEKKLAISEDMRKEWREHCMTAETRHWNAALEAAARAATNTGAFITADHIRALRKGER